MARQASNKPQAATARAASPRPRHAPRTDDDKMTRAIARRAYAIYLERGGSDGHDLEDWLEAERQVRSGG